MPCNCGKGKKNVSSSNPANYRQESRNIKRQPVRSVRPPATQQNTVNTAGRPTIKRSVRALPQGVTRTRHTKRELIARVLKR